RQRQLVLQPVVAGDGGAGVSGAGGGGRGAGRAGGGVPAVLVAGGRVGGDRGGVAGAGGVVEPQATARPVAPGAEVARGGRGRAGDRVGGRRQRQLVLQPVVAGDGGAGVSRADGAGLGAATVGGGVPAVLLAGGRVGGHRAGEAPAGAVVEPQATAGQIAPGEGRAARGQHRVAAGVGADPTLREADLVLGHVGAGDGLGRVDQHRGARRVAQPVALVGGGAGGD